MKNTAITLLLFFAIQAHAGDLYFYSEWAKYKDTTSPLECIDKIKNNSNKFLEDLDTLLSSYENAQWAVAQSIVHKYIQDTTVKSDLLHSLTECSDEYVFSDGQDYFFELDMITQKFLIGVDVALERKQQCGPHVGEEIRTIKDLVGLINTSPLKSANKAPKSALRAGPR